MTCRWNGEKICTLYGIQTVVANTEEERFRRFGGILQMFWTYYADSRIPRVYKRFRVILNITLSRYTDEVDCAVVYEPQKLVFHDESRDIFGYFSVKVTANSGFPQ